MKADLKEGPREGRGDGVRLKLDVQGQGGSGLKNVGRRCTRGVGSLQSWRLRP